MITHAANCNTWCHYVSQVLAFESFGPFRSVMTMGHCVAPTLSTACLVPITHVPWFFVLRYVL